MFMLFVSIFVFSKRILFTLVMPSTLAESSNLGFLISESFFCNYIYITFVVFPFFLPILPITKYTKYVLTCQIQNVPSSSASVSLISNDNKCPLPALSTLIDCFNSCSVIWVCNLTFDWLKAKNSSENLKMYHNRQDYSDSSLGNNKTKLLSRLDTLRKRMKSLQEGVQRERTLIDYHMQAAASQHTVSKNYCKKQVIGFVLV